MKRCRTEGCPQPLPDNSTQVWCLACDLGRFAAEGLARLEAMLLAHAAFDAWLTAHHR